MSELRDVLLERVMSGIQAQAKRSTRDRWLREDLAQEGALAALVVLDRYPDRSLGELILLAGRAARNRIIDVMVSRRQKLVFIPDDGPPVEDPSQEEADCREAMLVLLSKISLRARVVLESDLTGRANPADIFASKATLSRDRAEIRRKAAELGIGNPPESRSPRESEPSSGQRRGPLPASLRAIREDWWETLGLPTGWPERLPPVEHPRLTLQSVAEALDRVLSPATPPIAEGLAR